MTAKILLAASTAILLVGLIPFSSADAEGIDVVVKSVKEVCQSPSDQGSYWDVQLKGDGKARIKLIGALSGEAEFSKGEWKGVQRVLREHQMDDSKSYRACVEKITPIFVDKFAQKKEVKQSHIIQVKSFPRRPNQVSGMTLKMYVDDRYVGDIGNLNGVEKLNLGQFDEGYHKFRFDKINGYFIDAKGNAQQNMDASDLDCDGEFRVTRPKTFKLVVWLQNNDLTCELK